MDREELHECGLLSRRSRRSRCQMPRKYLNDRYDTEATRLKPDESQKDLAIIQALASIGLDGDIYHVLQFVPEQFEDEYIILIDAKLVVSFELSRRGDRPLPEVVRISFFTDYRRQIGQGRDRILLDRAADAARAHKISRDSN